MSPAREGPAHLAANPERRGVGAADLHIAPVTLDEMKRSYIVEVLERSGWTIEGKDGAAAKLGMPASTLRSKMKKLGIRRRT